MDWGYLSSYTVIKELKALSLDDIKKLDKESPDVEKVLLDVKGLYKVQNLNNSGMRYWRL